jgi:hypothetical protein
MAKAVPPDEETFVLKLTAKEHEFLREHFEGLEPATAAKLKPAPPKQGYQLTFDQLEDLAIHITGLVRAIPDAEAHRTINSIFRKVSDVMAVAAAEEAEADDDLKQVISLKKARDEEATENEAKETESFLNQLMAQSLATGLDKELMPPDTLPIDDLRTMAEELDIPNDLRRRLLDPGYRLTVADSMVLCKAVVGSLADDPSAESAELLRLLRDVSDDNPLEEMAKEVTKSSPRRKPVKKANKRGRKK